MTHVAGMPIAEYCAVCGKCSGWQQIKEEVVRQVRESAYHIIGYKGATCYAIGLALVRIVGAILRNEHSVLTVSSLLEGEFGIRGVCLSVPCLVSAAGVERIMEGKLEPSEVEALSASAAVLRQTVEQVDETLLKVAL
jgi:L-lactate dehydrogenase